MNVNIYKIKEKVINYPPQLLKRIKYCCFEMNQRVSSERLR